MLRFDGNSNLQRHIRATRTAIYQTGCKARSCDRLQNRRVIGISRELNVSLHATNRCGCKANKQNLRRVMSPSGASDLSSIQRSRSEVNKLKGEGKCVRDLVFPIQSLTDHRCISASYDNLPSVSAPLALRPRRIIFSTSMMTKTRTIMRMVIPHWMPFMGPMPKTTLLRPGQ